MAVSAILVDAALVVAAVVGLGVGASQFVAGASRLARRVGLSGLVVGLTVVSFGTSAPEFAVTIDAALTAKPDISVANVVGSNVVNLGFILGGVALVRALPTSRALVRRDGTVLIGTTGLVLLLLWDLRLSRLEGGVLFALLVVYLFTLLRSGGTRITNDRDAATASPVRNAVRALVGLAAVIAGAHVLVLSAADLARVAGVSEWVIGVTVVAAGTSMPEFATSVAAARRGRTGLSAGNLVGSCVFNLLGVLGLAALVQPLPVVGTAIESTLWLLGTAAIVVLMFWSNEMLSRLEGGVLVLLNAANWVVDFLG
jgi:cation:H+ antiporter